VLDRVAKATEINFLRIVELAALAKECFWRGAWYVRAREQVRVEMDHKRRELLGAQDVNPDVDDDAAMGLGAEEYELQITELERYRAVPPAESGHYHEVEFAFDRHYQLGSSALLSSLVTAAWTALAATRHAIVHNAGNADEEFKKMVVRHPTLSLVREGDPIDLDGEIVVDFVNFSLSGSLDILAFVDNWLSVNPT
jgi:hypothetical protein